MAFGCVPPSGWRTRRLRRRHTAVPGAEHEAAVMGLIKDDEGEVTDDPARGEVVQPFFRSIPKEVAALVIYALSQVLP